MIKPINEQQLLRIAEAAVAYQKAETRRNSLRRELNTMYSTYFRAHGHPYPDSTKRIDPEDEAFEGVLHFTNAAYRRWVDQRDLTTRLKRKLRTLVERLERV